MKIPKIKIDRIISIATLAASVLAVVLVLKRPAQLARPMPSASIAANADSFDQKMAQLQGTEDPPSSTVPESQAESPAPSAKESVHVNSDELNAVLAQSLGTASASQLPADSDLAAPTIKDQQINLEGDLVRGQFLTEVAGKDVWITVSGHIGSKDGYASFDPTEFKVGDLNVPVSFVNPALQKKLTEQRDRLKLPDYVGDMRVENGELVLTRK